MSDTAKEYETANLAVARYEHHCDGLLDAINDAMLEDPGVDALNELSKEFQQSQRMRDYWRGVLGRSKAAGG